jgi:hypothetical protein
MRNGKFPRPGVPFRPPPFTENVEKNFSARHLLKTTESHSDPEDDWKLERLEGVDTLGRYKEKALQRKGNPWKKN